MARQRRPRRDQSDEAGDRRLDTFVRGLLSGALVGAVIAGSTIWQRRHRKGSVLAPPAAPVPDVDAVRSPDQDPG